MREMSSKEGGVAEENISMKTLSRTMDRFGLDVRRRLD